MRYELRRRFTTIARCLAELGEAENARAIARRVHDGSIVTWLRGEHGEHVWAEVEAVARFASRYRLSLPSLLCGSAVALEHAYGEAEALLAEELPRPSPVPAEARPTVPAPVVVLVPRSTPPRAA